MLTTLLEIPESNQEDSNQRRISIIKKLEKKLKIGEKSKLKMAKEFYRV
jgi:hypothetical protein